MNENFSSAESAERKICPLIFSSALICAHIGAAATHELPNAEDVVAQTRCLGSDCTWYSPIWHKCAFETVKNG